MKTLMFKLRQFIAAISEQALYYVALIAGIFSWGYFNSIYAAAVVFIIGIALAWFISSKIEGRENK
jgi:hypothetical protein